MFAVCNSHVVTIQVITNEEKENILLDGDTQ